MLNRLRKLLKVIAGDTVDLEVYAKYSTYNGNNTNTVLGNDLINAIAMAFTPAGATAEVTQAIFDQFNMAGTGAGLLAASPNNGAPAAYLNYILFDNQFNYLSSGYKAISTAAAGSFEQLSIADILINQKGYLYIYACPDRSIGVSNEDMSNVNVHFPARPKPCLNKLIKTTLTIEVK